MSKNLYSYLKWYLDSLGKVKYNDINFSYSDGAWNNWFIGKWQQYTKSSNVKKCNWGDLRIPESKGFDDGIGEFHPNEHYKSFGWDNYLKAYFSDSIDTKEARKIEEIKWWLKSRTPKEKSNSRTSANSQNIP